MTSGTPSRTPAPPVPAARLAATATCAPALLAAFAAVLLAAGVASAEPRSIADRRAEAQRVLADIRAIDSSLAKAAEAYNLATIKLDRIAREQRDNRRRLVLARNNLGRAQHVLQRRLVALYTSTAQSESTLAVLLGATSLDDLLARVETVDRVSEQDAEVVRQVRSYRDLVQRRKSELARARAEQARVVAERRAYKRQVEQRLAERRRLLASIQSEIQRLEAAERARQLAAARRVRERLRAQQAASERAAAASEAAGESSGAGTIQAAAVGAAASTPEASVAPPARYGGVVGIAMQYLGTPYKWGGASPSSGFDCSGFVMYVFSQVGVSLPHNAAAQYGMGTPVSRSELQPGDLVFFDGLGHNGIYVGGGSFIHSPHTGDVVKISSMSGWYASTYVGARRL